MSHTSLQADATVHLALAMGLISVSPSGTQSYWEDNDVISGLTCTFLNGSSQINVLNSRMAWMSLDTAQGLGLCKP